MKKLITFSILMLIIYYPIDFSFAQNAQKYYNDNRYTKAIEILEQQGQNKDDSQLKLLGQSYMLRAYFLRDIANFQVRIGQQYYLLRDTSKTAIKTARRMINFFIFITLPLFPPPRPGNKRIN